MNLPNKLTVLRVVLVPFFVAALLINFTGHIWVALALFAIASHNMQQALRISDRTAFFLLGELVEYGDTETMFSTPSEKRTEDYITGRFG